MAESGAQCWAIALSEEITPNEVHSRRCLDQEIAVFRDAAGHVQALEDRCAHRRAPLSLGRVTDRGLIQCGYHGWTYDGGTGRCVAIPNLSKSENVPARYGVRKYRTLEQNGFVYVGAGVEEGSDSLRPPFADLPGHSTGGHTLLTLSHETFTWALLDGPWVMLNLGDVTVVPDHRIGDPHSTQDEDHIVTDYAAEWTRNLAGQDGGLPDPSFILRMTFARPTGMASIQLLNEAEETLVHAHVASLPMHAGVTAVRWRYVVTPLGAKALQAPTFSITDRPSPVELLKLTDLGIKAWRGLSFAARAGSPSLP
jgi:nitrite reductase/ring-hydroxylating ferredoxin subunit